MRVVVQVEFDLPAESHPERLPNITTLNREWSVLVSKLLFELIRTDPVEAK